jgi:hypothetical protein
MVFAALRKPRTGLQTRNPCGSVREANFPLRLILPLFNSGGNPVAPGSDHSPRLKSRLIQTQNADAA